MDSGPPSNYMLPSPLNTDDPDQMFTCPYDKHHRIRASRYSHHIIKCGKIHGVTLKVCPFNASHHIPEEWYENHLRTCVDIALIKQDVEKDMGQVPQLAKVASKSQVCDTGDGEDWDEEIAEENQFADYEEEYEEPEENDLEEEGDYVEEESIRIDEPIQEKILEERPANWDSMNAVQKKNYKRKYKRQQERLKAAGCTTQVRSSNPEDWTEEERRQRIDAILAKYPLVGKSYESFTDFKSLLNQICQKLRINPPIYREAPPDSQFGGFGAECIIKSTVYRSHGYVRTKRDAEHNAAKWTLLSIDIPLEGEVQGRLPSNVDDFRAKDEIRRLQAANLTQVKRLRQPGAVPSTTKESAPQPTQRIQPTVPKTTTNGLGNLMLKESPHTQVNTSEENLSEWQTVTSKKSTGPQGIGRGRGRGRGMWKPS